MPTLRLILARRWPLAGLGVATLLFGLAMLHPYPRQSLFGPKIDGVPWCVWESEIRRAATPSRSKSWFFTWLEKVGLLKPSNRIEINERPQLLPVYLHLADDPDMDVRRFSLGNLERRVLRSEFWRWSEGDEATILPIMRQHLHDDDPLCRLVCAEYIWRATKDREMIKVPLAYLDHPDPFIQRGACIVVCYLTEADLDASFDPIAKLACDAKSKLDIRTTAIFATRHFGKRGWPIIRKALNDPVSDIRRAGLFAVSKLGKDAEELIPDLLAMQNDVDPDVRRWTASTLNKIDAKRFPAPPVADE